MPIKDFIHHYPRALFNDIPRVGTHFYDIPGSGRSLTTYPGRGAFLRHTQVGAQFNDIPRSGRSLTTYPGYLNNLNMNQNISSRDEKSFTVDLSE